jgi:Ulp1 family protease
MADFVAGAELGSGLDFEIGDLIPNIDRLDILDLDDNPDEPIEQDPEEYVILNDQFLRSDRLSRADFSRLDPGQWLNDSLIDLFMR